MFGSITVEEAMHRYRMALEAIIAVGGTDYLVSIAEQALISPGD